MLLLASVSALCIVCYLDSAGTFCLLNLPKLSAVIIIWMYLVTLSKHFVPCLQDILQFALRLC